MKKYMIIDFMNMAHRAKHATPTTDIGMKLGMVYHTIFNSIKYSNSIFGATHVIICSEGSSWRKKVYSPYKRNRDLLKLQKTAKELEEDRIFLEGMTEMLTFFTEQTNATVVNSSNTEADDLISLFIDMHPDDTCCIISTDSDYYQLLSDKVHIYDGVKGHVIRIDGVFDQYMKPIMDKHTNKPMVLEDPQYLLFEKCIRGDSSDNVMSAYPGVRKKGTKNKVGIIQCFEDLDAKGYDYNNFMQQVFIDHEGIERKVLDRYEENRRLIDLRAQPEEIKLEAIQAIMQSLQKEPVSNVGFNFMKFCGLHELNSVLKSPQEICAVLNQRYY